MNRFTRRTAACASALTLLLYASNAAAIVPQTPIAGATIPQFVERLPTLSVAGGTFPTIFGNAPTTLTMCEFKANILPTGTFAPGVKPETWVWGYQAGTACPAVAQDTYLGPVIVNTRGTPTEITFVNNLGDTATSNLTFWKNSVDQTLHWADPLNGEMNECAMHAMMGMIPAPGSPCSQSYAGPIPAVPHLHGGEVPPMLDGGPDAWFTSDGAHQGHGYYTRTAGAGNQAIYAYPNTQEASPIWFHDHTLGATRLNVYAGLAGGYLVTDPALALPANLPGPAQIIPVVIQDRMFDTNGQLFFPSDSLGGALAALNPQHPYWVPEFVGDTIVVNGKAWPYLNVQPKRYRFLFLNGSNARTYELFLANEAVLPRWASFLQLAAPAMWVIGTDGGYLDRPAPIYPFLGQKLVMMPGERYEVIIDFAGVRNGTRFQLRNTAAAPYPAGIPADPLTTGRVMQFRVACPATGCRIADPSYNPAGRTPLRTGTQVIQRLANPITGAVAAGVVPRLTRQVTLNEVMGMPGNAIDPVTGIDTAYPGGPLEILVNNTRWSGASPRTYNDFTPITVGGVTTAYSELPQEGDTEVWEIVNTTVDAHPMHLHLVQFQIVNRQVYDTVGYGAAYAAAFPAVPGDSMCTGGVFCPDFGPPLDYYTGNPRALGGNPDITPFLVGAATPPARYEAGWKDTVVVPPGAVTRIAVRWAPTSVPATAPLASAFFPFDPNDGNQHGYVWHCHIVDHEDNEMMRPDVVQLNPLAPAPALRPLVKGRDY
jgi:spore coat protein A